MDPAHCPWCEAPRTDGLRCPRCGADYARAAALRAQEAGARAGPPARPRAAAPPLAADAAPPPAPPAWAPGPELGDWRLEHRLRLWVVPAALALAALASRSPLGHLLERVFLSMMVHETGHAAAGWLSGIASVPTPWVTYSAGSRGAGPALLVAAALGGLLAWGLRRRRPGVAALAGALLVAQGACTLLVSEQEARCLVTFAGDGGAMVLGTALMASFFVTPGSRLQQGGLRWGFAVIGAAAFADPFTTWWAARRDIDAIPFGVQEGVGLSDPSRLVQTCHWTTASLVQRHLALGIACLLALALAWWTGVRTARRACRGASR